MLAGRSIPIGSLRNSNSACASKRDQLKDLEFLVENAWNLTRESLRNGSLEPRVTAAQCKARFKGDTRVKINADARFSPSDACKPEERKHEICVSTASA